MNAPEKKSLPPKSMLADYHPKNAVRRRVLIILACVLMCSGLSALVVRAVQTAREEARCKSCVWHLRLIGMGLQIFDHGNGSLPPAYLCDKKGKPIHSWRTFVMPLIGEYGWQNAYTLKEPWDGPNNRKLLSQQFSSFRSFQCPNVDRDNDR